MLRGQGSQDGLPLLLCDLGQMPASLWPQFTLPWKAIGFHHLWGSDLVVDPSKNERAGGMTELRGLGGGGGGPGKLLEELTLKLSTEG